MAYYRNGVFEDGAWHYLIHACMNEFLATFPQFDANNSTLKKHIRDLVNRFTQTGTVHEGKSSERPGVFEDIFQNDGRKSKNFYACVRSLLIIP
ncbi:hypothetical protein Zmor_018323 [Zophobas morio]|uniref:Uncharacterized protein n=1 Tax=Zophobas morio TaxID=2755281 RepID=A0AA38I6W8_9CUCU|nr:hypothetical protein Zmor_018323 [Zophobas morio]